MGVADYKLSAALPAPLQAALPTAEDLAREFPMMTLVKLRIDIGRELRALIEGDGVESDRPLVLSEMVLLNEGVCDLPSTKDFIGIVSSLNKAAHGIDIPAEEAERASATANRFLFDIRAYRTST